jgi:sugar/nucleoside kinase (ribokinase family)
MASKTEFDVLCIGNAIVDMIANAEEDFLSRFSLTKSAMHLIDEERAEKLYKAMGPVTEISGGSAANTAAALASFGAKTAFIGKVKDDDLGQSFIHDIRAAGVHFATQPAKEGPATARSMILVTPDGERTMNTYLGACQRLSVADIDAAIVANAKVTYMEGYLWDPPEAKKAFREAMGIARTHGRDAALTLSDLFCIDSYRSEFLELMRKKALTILFANEAELNALYETSDVDTALGLLRKDIALGIVTRSEKGCIIVKGEETVSAPAQKIDKLVDTTGAGDLFAAGFLFGYTRDFSLKRCGELGVLAASEILTHLGARPQVNLRRLAQETGLL